MGKARQHAPRPVVDDEADPGGDDPEQDLGRALAVQARRQQRAAAGEHEPERQQRDPDPGQGAAQLGDVRHPDRERVAAVGGRQGGADRNCIELQTCKCK